MTGHMLGAAGAIEALACLFALNEGVIPPTINLNEQDENCDLNCVPNTAVECRYYAGTFQFSWIWRSQCLSCFQKGVIR